MLERKEKFNPTFYLIEGDLGCAQLADAEKKLKNPKRKKIIKYTTGLNFGTMRAL